MMSLADLEIFMAVSNLPSELLYGKSSLILK